MMKKTVLFIVIIFSLTSCDVKNEKKLLPGSIGRFNELMVVITHKNWEGKIGNELKNVITSDVVGLPQPEPQFAITQIPHKGFSGFLKHNRNVLSIEKAEQASFDVEYDVFSRPQIYVHIKGPDQQAIVELIRENSDRIITIYKDHDLKMVQKRLGKTAHKLKLIEFFTNQKISFRAPKDYSIVDDTKDFVWFRKRIEHYGHNVNGSLNIVAYTIPLEVPFEQIKDSIVSIRDFIGEKYLPGENEGSYLITEAAYTPHVFDVTLDEKNAYKINGKWEVYNDFMAGPFVSYMIHDEKNNRLVVVEGLVYAPIIKKRDFIFELDAIIRSLHIE